MEQLLRHIFHDTKRDQLIKFFKNKDNDKELSDEQLISNYKSSLDNKWIELLFKRYAHLVFGVCMKYLQNETEAEDASMEIFESLFSKLETHDVEYFNGWIYSVAKNQCLMILRKNKTKLDKKRNIYDNYYADFVENEMEEHHNIIEQTNNLRRLEPALLSLKQEQQNCIKLMYLENHSYKEICEKTGYTLKQVKSYIQNGKRKLKIFLEEK